MEWAKIDTVISRYEGTLNGWTIKISWEQGSLHGDPYWRWLATHPVLGSFSEGARTLDEAKAHALKWTSLTETERNEICETKAFRTFEEFQAKYIALMKDS